MNVRLWVLGACSPGLTDTLRAGLPLPFSYAEVAHGERVLETAYSRARAQYDASRLLDSLPIPESGWVHLGVTEVDLFVPALTYVFGLSELGAGRGVVSTFRLQPEQGAADAETVFGHRILVEAVHELGHALGLVHCPITDCAMRRAAWAEAVDLKRPSFCPGCLMAAQATGGSGPITGGGG